LHRCNILSMRVLAVLGATVASLAGATLSGQAPAATPGASSAVGTVFDSVRLRPLVGARVRLDTTDMVATVDRDGRFRLEGIPDGSHYLRVEHPFLDTVGIVLRSPVQRYSAGSSFVGELATPSPETLINMVCTPAWRARGPAALMGRVREADSGTPATGAKVSLVWYEIEVSSGIRRTPRLREVNVGPDGTYRICGLPPQLDGRVQVLRGELTSGDILINFGDDLLFLRSMSIAAPSAVIATSDSSRPEAPRTLQGTSRLVGKVLNNAGQPLVGARVQVDGTTRVASTRSTGDFVLDSLPAGTQTVSVRLLGYAPTEQAVDLSSREARSVTIKLTDFVPVLEAVRVSATRERALDAVGFARRKRTGQGHYLEGDQINTNSLYFSDVLRVVPSVRVQSIGGRQMITSSRDINGCVAIWVDGNQWQQLQPGDIDEFVKPHELAAIEVYSAATAPAEFQSTRTGSCTTIVAWTARRLDRKR
jgi:hypothetical protein